MRIGIWATNRRAAMEDLVEKALRNRIEYKIVWATDREKNPFRNIIPCDVILVGPKSHIGLLRSIQTFQKKRLFSPPVVMITEEKFFPPLLGRLISAGISGSISPEAADKLLKCLTTVIGGNYYFDLPMSSRTIRDYICSANLPGFEATLEQLEAWRLLVGGMDTQQVADELKVDVDVIEARKRALVQKLKLNLNDQAALIDKAADYQLSAQQSNANA
jgi:DNA-binding NarL/FixJ family response regulator